MTISDSENLFPSDELNSSSELSLFHGSNYYQEINQSTRGAILTYLLDIIPPGKPQWQNYERLGIEILNYLFCPDILRFPYIHPLLDAQGLYSAKVAKRPDAIYPINNISAFLPEKFSFSQYVVVEFKNLVASPNYEEVEQTVSYLSAQADKLEYYVQDKLLGNQQSQQD